MQPHPSSRGASNEGMNVVVDTITINCMTFCGRVRPMVVACSSDDRKIPNLDMNVTDNIYIFSLAIENVFYNRKAICRLTYMT